MGCCLSMMDAIWLDVFVVVARTIWNDFGLIFDNRIDLSNLSCPVVRCRMPLQLLLRVRICDSGFRVRVEGWGKLKLKAWMVCHLLHI